MRRFRNTFTRLKKSYSRYCGRRRILEHRVHILKILHHTNGHITKTVQILGISRPKLRQKTRQNKSYPQQA
ncbi:helix-turn-helix domain-containing protein [Syntrophus gentianae]|uniref:helix-turn-helix domain-containing protein n=1 Tax=Syntrophus gentianae TaxID=43775 RepID=UPI000B885D82|nr:helix-turn-helix domain-containing protein [Syntrophus gentianae]